MSKPDVNRCKSHLYLKTKTKTGSFVYKCTRCPHYSPEAFIIGRQAICWYCSNEFVMHKGSTQVKPHCGCRNVVKINRVTLSRKDDKKKAAAAVLDEIVRKL